MKMEKKKKRKAWNKGMKFRRLNDIDFKILTLCFYKIGRVRKLAYELGINNSCITQLIKKLEKMDYIEVKREFGLRKTFIKTKKITKKELLIYFKKKIEESKDYIKELKQEVRNSPKIKI